MRVCWMRKGIMVGVKHPRPCSLGSGCYGPKQPAATRLAGSDPPGEATHWTATIRQHHFGFAKTTFVTGRLRLIGLYGRKDRIWDAPSNRAACHDLPLLGTGRIGRASHDVSAAGEP